jgi:hypothetical protein
LIAIKPRYYKFYRRQTDKQTCTHNLPVADQMKKPKNDLKSKSNNMPEYDFKSK